MFASPSFICDQWGFSLDWSHRGHRLLICGSCHGVLWVHYIKVTVFVTSPLFLNFFNLFSLYWCSTEDQLKKQKHFKIFSGKLGTHRVLSIYIVFVLKVSMFAKQFYLLASQPSEFNWKDSKAFSDFSVFLIVSLFPCSEKGKNKSLWCLKCCVHLFANAVISQASVFSNVMLPQSILCAREGKLW